MEEKLTVNQALVNIERFIAEGRSRQIRDIYKELSIFDWWPETLTMTRMEDMRLFLKEALKLGFKGYACFKVGAKGCANGMWAYKNESTNGYSPDGDILYKSFTPAYNYWQVKINNVWYPAQGEYDRCKTTEDIESLIDSINKINGLNKGDF